MIKKTCENCKYSDVDPLDVPCTGCLDGEYLELWEQGETDNVNHPSHYEGSTSLECFEVMEIAFGKVTVYDFCICNAFKYLWRYKNKNGVEDLNKAEWYLNKAEEMNLFEDDTTLKELKEVLEKHKQGVGL